MTTVYKIAESAMHQADSVQNFWAVFAPHGTPREATLLPIFWVHVARKLRPLAKVSVIAEDGTWYQELLCLFADGADIRMHELGYWGLEETVPAENAGDLSIKWAGPRHLYRVIRNSDGQIMEHGFRSKTDAMRWIGNHRVVV